MDRSFARWVKGAVNVRGWSDNTNSMDMDHSRARDNSVLKGITMHCDGLNKIIFQSGDGRVECVEYS